MCLPGKGIETVPLVERLFSDLVHTTESLKTIKTELAEKRSEGSSVVEQVEPYKADNAKLVKEVNQLHMELVRRKDAAASTIGNVLTRQTCPTTPIGIAPTAATIQRPQNCRIKWCSYMLTCT